MHCSNYVDPGSLADVIIPSVAVVVAAIGGGITIYIYYKNSRLEKAKWLYSLFEKFYYEGNYSEIRSIIDYNREHHISKLFLALTKHDNEELEEKMVNYLNFFEFIASLWKMNQLTLMEIRMMFDYYIRRLGDYDFILEYLENEGFEGLKDLVKEARGAKDNE